MSHLSQETVHRPRPFHTLYAGPQRNNRQGIQLKKIKSKIAYWLPFIPKVPNSLPSRSNVEIEIYGMEGIPANDLKEHEKQKNGNKSDSEDDEPANKKAKPEGNP
jgi:hypothetical protein